MIVGFSILVGGLKGRDCGEAVARPAGRGGGPEEGEVEVEAEAEVEEEEEEE